MAYFTNANCGKVAIINETFIIPKTDIFAIAKRVLTITVLFKLALSKLMFTIIFHGQKQIRKRVFAIRISSKTAITNLRFTIGETEYSPLCKWIFTIVV